MYGALSDESPSSGPRSALRGSRGSPAVGRKEVTIQTPEKPTELSAEQLERKTDMLLDEFLSGGDFQEAMACIEDLNSPNYYPDVIYRAILLSMEKKERERNELIALLSYLNEKTFFSPADFEGG